MHLCHKGYSSIFFCQATKFCVTLAFDRGDTPALPSSATGMKVGLATYFLLTFSFCFDTCGARSKACTLKGTRFAFDRGDTPALPSSATGMKDSLATYFLLTFSFCFDTCGARSKACTLKGTRFAFDRGDTPALPSSATGSGRAGVLPTSHTHR